MRTGAVYPRGVVLGVLIVVVEYARASMTEIKCPNCGKTSVLPDAQFRDALFQSTWYCNQCTEHSPVKTWSSRPAEKRGAQDPEIVPIAPDENQDTRTVEEKQRDWRDDNLRSEFR